MAVSQILIPPDASRDAKARQLVGQVGMWPLFTLKQPYGSFEAGTVFRRAYGSKGERYLVNSVACQCPDYAERGNVCKHVRAICLWEQNQQIDAAIAESFVSMPFSWADLRESMPSCAGGCGELIEGGSPFCVECSAKRAREEKMAAARRRVVEDWI